MRRPCVSEVGSPLLSEDKILLLGGVATPALRLDAHIPDVKLALVPQLRLAAGFSEGVIPAVRVAVNSAALIPAAIPVLSDVMPLFRVVMPVLGVDILTFELSVLDTPPLVVMHPPRGDVMHPPRLEVMPPPRGDVMHPPRLEVMPPPRGEVIPPPRLEVTQPREEVIPVLPSVVLETPLLDSGVLGEVARSDSDFIATTSLLLLMNTAI